MTADGFLTRKLTDLFDIQSGDFHSVDELDLGDTPVISCGDSNNGCVGFYNVPNKCIYHNCITVAYNGKPLLSKYHPYKFGTKDDVGILIPRFHLAKTTLLYISAQLNQQVWRYSYGRKCYQEKMKRVLVNLPFVVVAGKGCIDEQRIESIVTGLRIEYPKMPSGERQEIPQIKWGRIYLKDLFYLDRGDFHSISALCKGEYLTVSRVSTDNGVVGCFTPPKGARIYHSGLITISTVGGDAFVQTSDFLATDNVIICSPKKAINIETLVFISFMLNRQKWRYSYGRQCYLNKIHKVGLFLPVDEKGAIDETIVKKIVKQTSYWERLSKHFGTFKFPNE